MDGKNFKGAMNKDRWPVGALLKVPTSRTFHYLVVRSSDLSQRCLVVGVGRTPLPPRPIPLPEWDLERIA